MRIAIYSHSIAPSIDGVCRRFTGLLKELSKQGHELLLFTLEDAPQDIATFSRYVTLDHMIIPSYPEKKVARPNFRNLIRMWSAIREFKPDIVHVTADGFSHMFALVGGLLGVTVIGSFHTDLIDLLSTHNAAAFQLFCVSLKERLDSVVLDSCATTSTSFMKKLKLRGIDCQHVIMTAVDGDTFRKDKKNDALRKELTFNDPSGGFLCVYVGRISKEKRIDLIVEAVRSIEGAYLAIIGDGPSAHVFEAMHGKENRIYCKPRFLTHPELAEVYASSDIHVSASQFETLGNTVLEAFACGIPVVVPRTQGFCDTVKDKIDGFLFEPGDSASAQLYIKKLKDEPKLRAQMGNQGQSLMFKQTTSHVVGDLLQWYEQGKQRRREKSLFVMVLIMLLLIVTVPLAFVLLNCYDLLMFIILSFGYNLESRTNGHTKTTPTLPAASASESDSAGLQENDSSSSKDKYM